MKAGGPIGAAIETVGHLFAAKSAKETGWFNRAVAERNALGIERDATAEEAEVRREVRQAIGAQIAAQGASGFQIGQGSAADAIAESQIAGMLDAMNLRRKAATAADAERLRGRLAKKEADAAATASYFGAAKTAASAAVKYGAK